MATVTYVKTGLAGYGPDLEPEDTGYVTLEETCEAIRDELSSLADFLIEGANIAGDEEDYEEAWKTAKLAESLETLRANLDYAGRSKAPLYRDNGALLDETMERIIGENFPLDVSLNGYTRLYVWQADEPDEGES